MILVLRGSSSLSLQVTLRYLITYFSQQKARKRNRWSRTEIECHIVWVECKIGDVISNPRDFYNPNQL
ncbi:hypothetical protein PITC_033650 [Penicillium italicum]|uniref:Uncharacterized protein n=1 Tax=Penicillium italicum TaxID=40296 RepID=A0A0A2L9C1_PENIT|nr:hypothetical protein PITC_033650 [Penicillium italicum]